MTVGSFLAKASCCSWLAFWITAWMAAVAGSVVPAAGEGLVAAGEAAAVGPGEVTSAGGGVDVDGVPEGTDDELGPLTAGEPNAPDATEQPVSASATKSTSGKIIEVRIYNLPLTLCHSVIDEIIVPAGHL